MNSIRYADSNLGDGQNWEMPVASDCQIVVRDVDKAFHVDGRVVQALEGVSVEACSEEFVALIGPSGGGKSTLLNIICGLMEPDRGEVILYGQPNEPRLGHVAYMPQRDLLLPWRTVLENVLLGPEVMRRDMTEAREEALDLMSLFGLEGFEHNYPGTLSGGMRQRAALLRTLLCKQEIVALDEPFGALDALTRWTMRAWLLEVWARFRQTMLFVTHDVEEAIFLSDRIYVLSGRPGRVVKHLRVDLPRPRGRHLVAEPHFDRYREELLDALGI